jgi:hypothetical protein
MTMRFDPDTIERLRSLPPEKVVEEVRRIVFAADDAGSEDFLAACAQLVEEGILTWDRVEELEQG